jgi:lysozyme
MNRDALATQLMADEGVVLKPYRCTAGKLTIGVGRNLEDIGISKEEAMVLLANDIARVEAQLDARFPWWRKMSESRQMAFANFAFNVGIGTVLTFKNTLAAMERGDYEAAAKGLEDSRWYSQVGNRAKRVVELIRKG